MESEGMRPSRSGGRTRTRLFWPAVVSVGFTIGALATIAVLHTSNKDTVQHAGVANAQGFGPLGGAAPVLVSGKAAGKNGVAQAPSPPPPVSLMDNYQIVSYYGNPLSSALGALGEGTQDEMLDRLKAQASTYQALSPNKTVIPALHLIYEVAQQFPGDDGLYLYRADDATVQQLIQLTRDQHMLLFLDLQIGRSNLAAEVEYVMPYLQQPNVHLAIDPEFVTPPGQRPGLDIGSLDCNDINTALDKIEAMTEALRIPNKIVIVHQFEDYMLTNKDKLRYDEPRVDVVLDMDGFGPQAGKLGKYDSLIRQSGAKYAGIKLFYKHDTNLLSEEQVEDLDPQPNVIIYQ